MNQSDRQREILELAVEDLYGLWEIIWRLRSRFPDSKASELRNIAEATVRELVTRGYVVLYRRSKAPERETLLTVDEADTILSIQTSWDDPIGDSVQILIGATEEGKHAYYSLEEGRQEK